MALFDQVLLTSDYDRTLTAPDSTIPQANLEAIAYFMENGGAFTVNTGRSIPMARAFWDKVPVNAPLLLYNGSAAYDKQTDTFLFAHPIPLDPWKTMEICMQEFPQLMVEIQGTQAHYRFRENPMWDAFCAYNGCAGAAAQPEMTFDPFLKFSLYGELRDPTVSHLFEATSEEMGAMDQAEAALRQRFGDVCAIFRAGARIIDIHAKGVSKARSARQLQKQLGRKILVCIGDAMNDLEMLQQADYAFVPGDAVLANRFETVCPCAQGAVAQVIYEKIPQILKNCP